MIMEFRGSGYWRYTYYPSGYVSTCVDVQIILCTFLYAIIIELF